MQTPYVTAAQPNHEITVTERLVELEDAYWSARAREVLAKGEPTVPWDQAVAESEAGDQADSA